MVFDWYNVSIQRVFKFCLEKLEKRYEEMNYKKRRDEVLSKMEKNSVLVLSITLKTRRKFPVM